VNRSHYIILYTYIVISHKGWARARVNPSHTRYLFPRVLLFVGIRSRERRGPLTSSSYLYIIIWYNILYTIIVYNIITVVCIQWWCIGIIRRLHIIYIYNFYVIICRVIILLLLRADIISCTAYIRCNRCIVEVKTEDCISSRVICII